MFERYVRDGIKSAKDVYEDVEGFETFRVNYSKDFRKAIEQLNTFKFIFRMRNGVHGVPYTPADVFAGNRFIIFLVRGWEINVDESGKLYHSYHREFELNDELTLKIFPRGIPKTPKEIERWRAYIGYIAKKEYGYQKLNDKVI